MHIQLKNRLWTTVALLPCCNLNWGLANDNYSLYFLQFLTDSGNLRLCYIFIPKLYIVGPLCKLTETSFFSLFPFEINITVLWSNTTQIVITHICVIFSRRMMSLSICTMVQLYIASEWKYSVLISNIFIYAKIGNSKFVEMHGTLLDIYPSALVFYTRHRVNITIYRTVYLHPDMCKR
jgi:hypothetical protein